MVRLYAFRALVAKQKDIPKNIIDLILNDNETVNIKDGDKVAKVPLNSIAKGFLY
jgi:thiamine biosynthesis lipoprotein ApbE